MIPTVAVGDTVFSDTHARFAASLIGDVGRALVKITSELDRDLMDAGRDADDPRRVLVQGLLVDVPALIVAANYCHWVSDHIRDEITRIHNADMRIGERFAALSGDADRAVLFRLELYETVPDAPPCEPPPFPAALQYLDRARRHWFNLDEKLHEIDEDRRAGHHDRFNQVLVAMTENRYARRLETIRETFAEARSALVRNRTDKTDVLVMHADALSAWAAGSQDVDRSTA